MSFLIKIETLEVSAGSLFLDFVSKYMQKQWQTQTEFLGFMTYRNVQFPGTVIKILHLFILLLKIFEN